MIAPTSADYIGRFAPSPSGPMHFGSLLAALASFLDARSNNGIWRVRIEDVDISRSVPNADKWILDSLHAHGLKWDKEVIYQSARTDAYQTIVDNFLAAHQAYLCTCTRKMIRESGGVYPGTCRNAHHDLNNTDRPAVSVRLKLDNPVTDFADRILGYQKIPSGHATEDFIVQRKDGLFAYNLAVVADDIFQDVTHVVRGSDLLETTAAHLSLYRLLGKPAPRYAHIPVAATEPGYKLSKQNKAIGLDNSRAGENLVQALKFLNIAVPATLVADNCDKILGWAIKQWDCDLLPKTREVIVDKSESTYYSQS
ncbi:tRNA glutamyl-Q(34) synthetase GluQRS [Salinimonas sp. HHU 13199]|uniref:Glutamyl-Q tRNA(Asp) synthetase n=1 Tax=Salinimonas profundi TaxID=2729140 RepID=A0ABR8LRI8_9ALTE|nr:tRNA glutamyl-Q(34) synthetase GluQRS [Salinimonas profundi]MBD3587037.1 tRNA glutamyl-Q(34) synthetase GluQRS [Salinimonas profundi]